MRVRIHWADIGGSGRTDVADVVGIGNWNELLAELNERKFLQIVFAEDLFPTILGTHCISSIEHPDASAVERGFVTLSAHDVAAR
jgi:hypothetical protein